MISASTGGKEWQKLLPKLCFAYNTSANSQTGTSPFHVIHGWDPLLITEAALGKELPVYEDLSLYVQDLLEHLSEVRKIVADKLNKNVEDMKSQQPIVRTTRWLPGMLVLIRRVDQTNKFDDKYEGPYRLIQEEGSNLLIREMNEETEPFLIHKDRCKHFLTPFKVIDETTNENKKKQKVADKNIESDEEIDPFQTVSVTSRNFNTQNGWGSEEKPAQNTGSPNTPVSNGPIRISPISQISVPRRNAFKSFKKIFRGKSFSSNCVFLNPSKMERPVSKLFPYVPIEAIWGLNSATIKQVTLDEDWEEGMVEVTEPFDEVRDHLMEAERRGELVRAVQTGLRLWEQNSQKRQENGGNQPSQAVPQPPPSPPPPPPPLPLPSAASSTKTNDYLIPLSEMTRKERLKVYNEEEILKESVHRAKIPMTAAEIIPPPVDKTRFFNLIHSKPL